MRRLRYSCNANKVACDGGGDGAVWLPVSRTMETEAVTGRPSRSSNTRQPAATGYNPSSWLIFSGRSPFPSSLHFVRRETSILRCAKCRPSKREAATCANERPLEQPAFRVPRNAPFAGHRMQQPRRQVCHLRLCGPSSRPRISCVAKRIFRAPSRWRNAIIL